MTGLDPRHPMVIDARVLGRRAGAMTEIRRAIPVTEDTGPIGTQLVAVQPGGVLDLELRLECVLEGVLASGTVRAEADGTCVRCLEPARVPVAATFQELYAYADRAAHHHQVGDDEADARVLVGDLLDLEPVLRDAIVPALPFQPRCRPDCPGLCDRCGEPLAQGGEHKHDEPDPRWAVLAGLATPSRTSPAPDPTGPGEQEKRN